MHICTLIHTHIHTSTHLHQIAGELRVSVRVESGQDTAGDDLSTCALSTTALLTPEMVSPSVSDWDDDENMYVSMPFSLP